MWHIGVPSSLGVVTTFAYNVEYAIIRREVRSGMYCTHHRAVVGYARALRAAIARHP